MPKVLLWNIKSNQPEDIEPVDVRKALASGDYTEYAEGRTNLLVGGKDVPVSLGADGGANIDKILLGNPASTDPAALAGEQAVVDRDAAFSGVDDYIRAGREGLTQGLTFGLYEGEEGYEGEGRREVRAGTVQLGKLVGELGSVFLPGTGQYALAKVAAGAGKATAGALGAGRVARVVGAGVEGAIFGASDDAAHQLVDVAVRDKPFVAERMASAAALGGLLNVGLHGVFERAGKIVADDAAKAAGADNPGLKALAEELKAAEVSQASVRKAIVPAAERAKVKQVVDSVRKDFEQAVTTHLDNLSLLKLMRNHVGDDAALLATREGHWLNGLDDDWFSQKFKLAEQAKEAGAKLTRWNTKKLVDLDAAGYRAFAEDWLAYEQKVARLDDILHLPPDVPLTKGSAPSAEVEQARRLGTNPGIKGKRGRRGDQGTKPMDDSPANRGEAPVEGRPAPADAAESATAAPAATEAAQGETGIRQHFKHWLQGSAGRPPAASRNYELLYGSKSSLRPDFLPESLAGKLSGELRATADRLANAGGLPGGVPGVTASLGLDTFRGQSPFIDALSDAWSVNHFARASAQEAKGKISDLRRGIRELERDSLEEAAPRASSSLFGNPRHRAAELGRFAARREFGGYAGFAAGQAAYGLIAGKLGRLVGWANGAKVGAAEAVTSLLGGGRTTAITKAITATKVAYNGDEEQATTDPRVKGDQLRNMVSNEEALRERLRKNLMPIAKTSPDLAMLMEDTQVNQLRNLALRAPAFLVVPGAVPKRPGPADNEFTQYEAVTHDPDLFIRSLKTASVTRPMVDAYREQHPAQYQHLVGELMSNMDEEKARKLPLAVRRQVEMVIGAPLFPRLGPSQQQHYAKDRQEVQQLPDGGPPNPRAVPRPSQGSQLMAPLVRPGQ